MQKGTYTAVIFSLLIHSLLLVAILITQSKKEHTIKPVPKMPPIKSFIYYAPNLVKAEPKVIDTESRAEESNTKAPASEHNDPLENSNAVDDVPSNIEKIIDRVIEKNPETATQITASKTVELPEAHLKIAKSKPLPEPTKQKLDSFTQLQRLRSKQNKHSVPITDNPYQRYQPPSVFNSNSKPVPHSVPLKDEEKEREKNTKNMGGGITITKGENGVCWIAQDLSVYGLSEGSSIQSFSCGESKFNKSFREHMKKVKNKLGKD